MERSALSNLALTLTTLQLLFLGDIAHGQRRLDFSGYPWTVKESQSPVGPGPNLFSGSPFDIWVDKEGLHLKIVERNGVWYSTECVLQEALGYGTYVIHTKSRLDDIDPNMVVGLFTWDGGAPLYNYRELDFEFARWGDPFDPTNAQFVVQPFGTLGNLTRYTIDLSPPRTEELTMIMKWSLGRAEFWSYYGRHSPESAPREDLVASWFNDGPDVPPPGNENFRFNFWLVNGNPPQSDVDDEVLITDFYYLSPSPQTASGTLLIESFEDGNRFNELKGLWTTFSGNETGQTFSVNGEVVSPGLDESNLSFAATGALPGFSPSFNYGGVVTELSPNIDEKSLDVSDYSFLEFDILVRNGGPYQVRLEDATHTFNSINVPISATMGTETSISIPVSAFEAGENGIDLDSVQKIVWTLQSDGDSAPFAISLDNVAFTGGVIEIPTPTPEMGEDILVDDLEDGNFENNLEGAWEVFDGNGICNPCGSVTRSIVQPGLNNSERAVSITGIVPPADGGFTFAGVVTRFGPSILDSLDLSGYYALEFDIQLSKGGPYNVRLEDKSHVAAGFQGFHQPHYQLAHTENIQRVKIPLAFFTSGMDGLDLSEVANIVWTPKTPQPGEPLEFIIDNVRIIASQETKVSSWHLY